MSQYLDGMTLGVLVGLGLSSPLEVVESPPLELLVQLLEMCLEHQWLGKVVMVMCVGRYPPVSAVL